jgi:hypothetical protein
MNKNHGIFINTILNPQKFDFNFSNKLYLFTCISNFHDCTASSQNILVKEFTRLSRINR